VLRHDGRRADLHPLVSADGSDRRGADPIGCPIIIFISMSNVTGIQYMVPVGMYNRYSASVIAGACINFCCNWMMIPKLRRLRRHHRQRHRGMFRHADPVSSPSARRSTSTSRTAAT
jgi:hypothetical protein